MFTTPPGYAIAELDPEAVRQKAADLAAVLIDCVDGGASVSFMSGLDHPRARRYWLAIAEEAERDGRAVLAAIREADGRIVGTVQMIPAPYENQPHRGDIAKMLVLRSERCRGLGAALMRAAEEAAQAAGKTLLVLDTASAEAERVYEALGWIKCGIIPGFALWPDGRPCDTTFYYKEIGPSRVPAIPST